ncbi:MAG TPA: hypothetical protein VEH62_09890 [Gemmatimonadales bacterium]|nr:hypothetical protein [Gemmatimonadales bacterium]
MTPGRIAIVVTALAGGLGGCVSAPGRFTQVPPGPVHALAFDQEIMAALGPSDGALRGGVPFQLWAFDGDTDETITLEVHGCGMNPLLAVLDAEGRELVRDRDGGPGRGARIEVTLPGAQRYYVVASRTTPGSAALVTPYTLYAASSRSPAPRPPSDLGPPPPLPPPGSQTRGLIVTGLADVGPQQGLPPARSVFGVDGAPVFYLFGQTGRIALSVLRSGAAVPQPVFGARQVVLQPHVAGGRYLLSAPLAPGTYCAEAPPTIAVASAIFRIGDATRPPEHDPAVVAVFATVVGAEGNPFAPALTRFASGQPVLLVARLGATPDSGVAPVTVTDASTGAVVWGAPPSAPQPSRTRWYTVGRLPHGRYVARLTVAGSVAARWEFRVD